MAAAQDVGLHPVHWILLVAGPDAGPDSSDRRETSTSPGVGGTVTGAQDRVLVVDDHPDVLATTAELFRIMGYEVLCASNGPDAIAILKNTPGIHVLFSDIVMPGMNGVRLAREARSLLPGINVILASGFPASAMNHGADTSDFHFLAKPFRIADIGRMLRK